MKRLVMCLAPFLIFSTAGCDAKQGYAVDELADKAVANKEAFMGKEVVVSGYIAHQPSVDKDGYSLSLKFDPTIHKERQLSCVVPDGKVPEEISDNWMDKRVTVKGQIASIHRQNYMDLKSVRLEPCELVK